MSNPHCRRTPLLHYLSLAWCSMLFVVVNGCGSPIVDSGRGRPPGAAAANGGAGAPGVGAMPNRNTPAIPSSSGTGWNNLEHIPANRVLTQPAGNGSAVYHEVKAGETMSSIGARYGVSAQSLTKANGLDANSNVQPGQLLFVPPAK